MKVDNAQVAEWMRSNKLTAETRLYRCSLPEFVKPTSEPGVVEISANEDPSEAVTDVYGQVLDPTAPLRSKEGPF